MIKYQDMKMGSKGTQSIYLSSNNDKPLLETKTYARSAAGILIKLKIKYVRIQVRF